MSGRIEVIKPGPAVTSVSVARLHNLGNYEHVRYEVTVGVPSESSAAGVLADVAAILGDLKPSHYNESSVRAAKAIVAQGEPPAPVEGDDYDKRRAHERWTEAVRLLKAEAVEQKRIQFARLALDNLGGYVRYTDAKLNWDDED